jgi:hypothetical protein
MTAICCAAAGIAGKSRSLAEEPDVVCDEIIARLEVAINTFPVILRAAKALMPDDKVAMGPSPRSGRL